MGRRLLKHTYQHRSHIDHIGTQIRCPTQQQRRERWRHKLGIAEAEAAIIAVDECPADHVGYEDQPSTDTYFAHETFFTRTNGMEEPHEGDWVWFYEEYNEDRERWEAHHIIYDVFQWD